MPLQWDEVTDSLDPRNYTIRSAVDRMQGITKDPVSAVLEVRPDLTQVLGALGVQMGAASA